MLTRWVGEECGTGNQETTLQRACRDTGLSDAELWLRYFALGGSSTPEAVRDCIHGVREPEATDYDVVVQAINERYMELHRPERLPYAPDV